MGNEPGIDSLMNKREFYVIRLALVTHMLLGTTNCIVVRIYLHGKTVLT